MSPVLFPIDQPLDATVMRARLQRYAHAIHAVHVWREPSADARFRILAKANIGTQGMPTHAGSKALQELHLPDAHCVHLLRKADCDVFGKTTMTELAGFVTTAKSNLGYSHLGGFPQNPHGNFPPQGSSSGSAVAVAAGLCDAALGTETRGSLMMPGLACAVVAYKPSRGLISRSRIIPISHHFDTPGVIARNVSDAQCIAEMMTGLDPEDPITQFCRQRQVNHRRRQTKSGRLRLAFLGSQDMISTLPSWFCQTFDVVPVSEKETDFDYKLITSLDIRNDMDDLLGHYAAPPTPSSFAQLYEFYRAHPDTHPFGMNRLDDAAHFEMLPRDEIDAIAEKNIWRARALIADLIEDSETDAVITTSFVDWWSISGAPSITVPMGNEISNKPIGLMVGTAFGEDATLIDVAKTIESHRRENNPL